MYKRQAYNNIALDLYFKTLTPIEFTDLDNAQTVEEVEEETGVKVDDQPAQDAELITEMKAHQKHECSMDMPEEYDDAIDELIAMGEDVDTEMWDLVDEREVDYEQEDALDDTLKFASTGTARPNADSEQDGENTEGTLFLVRYKYSGSRLPQRSFCRKMMSAKKVYRKEDILMMDNKAVNAGFGVNGSSTYSIWLYKGGARCKHKWIRQTYMSKNGIRPDVKSPNAKTISTTKARGKGFRPEANDDRVAITPSNMKNRGYVNPPSEKDIQGGL